MANMDEHSLLWQCLMKLILIVCFSKKKQLSLLMCRDLLQGCKYYVKKNIWSLKNILLKF